MTREEILEYNKYCAEFLGFKHHEHSEYWTTMLWGGAGFTPYQMKFHSDWNWIHEVIEAIGKLPFDKTEGLKEYMNDNFNEFQVHIFSTKEEVVQAINQFLIWYNENKNNNRET